MSSELRLRLAALQGDPGLALGPRPVGSRKSRPMAAAPDPDRGLADIGFSWDPERRIFVRSESVPLADLGLDQRALAYSRLASLSAVVPEDGEGGIVLFDLETTGLQRGAGTVPFLYGWGKVEVDHLQVEQWLLPQLGEELPLVEAALDGLRSAGLLVTYNGSSYDLPLLRARTVMTGADRAWPAPPHLDLLPVVRRLFRHRLERCTLRAAEVELLHRNRRGDVPGREAPERFWEYLRTGETAQLAAVVRHNREDVVSLIRLLDRLAGHLEMDAPHPSDWLSLGRFAESRGRLGDADRSYRSAELLSPPPLDRAGALRRARLLRRRGRADEAFEAWSAIWRRWEDPEAAEAMCVDLEHRRGDLGSALELARSALPEAPVGWDQRFARRIWRLEARVGGRAAPGTAGPNVAGPARPWAAWLPGGPSYEAWLALRRRPGATRERRLSTAG